MHAGPKTRQETCGRGQAWGPPCVTWELDSHLEKAGMSHAAIHMRPRLQEHPTPTSPEGARRAGGQAWDPTPSGRVALQRHLPHGRGATLVRASFLAPHRPADRRAREAVMI